MIFVVSELYRLEPTYPKYTAKVYYTHYKSFCLMWFSPSLLAFDREGIWPCVQLPVFVIVLVRMYSCEYAQTSVCVFVHMRICHRTLYFIRLLKSRSYNL